MMKYFLPLLAILFIFSACKKEPDPVIHPPVLTDEEMLMDGIWYRYRYSVLSSVPPIETIYSVDSTWFYDFLPFSDLIVNPPSGDPYTNVETGWSWFPGNFVVSDSLLFDGVMWKVESFDGETLVKSRSAGPTIEVTLVKYED